MSVKSATDPKSSRRIDWQGYLIPVLAACSLLISCTLISTKKLFWFDELLTVYLVNDPSFIHMLRALGDQVDTTPPLFYILAWLWAKLFGGTELPLRLFSSLGFCGALFAVWAMLRRAYSSWVSAIVVLGVFCLSHIILLQNAEARFYGLFLVVSALGCLQFVHLANRPHPSWRSLLFNAIIHAAIVLSHVFGVLYSVAILGAFILRDRYFKVFRPSVYLSILLGYLAFLPWLPSFLRQSDVGNPVSWLPTPRLASLAETYGFSILSSFRLNLVLWVVLIGLMVISLRFLFTATFAIDKLKTVESSQAQLRSLNAEISLHILAWILLSVPVVAWLVSVMVKPIFSERYMIPSMIGWSILLAYPISRFLVPAHFSHWLSPLMGDRRPRNVYFKQLLFSTIVIGCLIYPVVYATKFNQWKYLGLLENRYGYETLPVAVESAQDYLPRFYYAPQPSRYSLILYWQIKQGPNQNWSSTVDYKLMQALKRHYPFHQMMQGNDFLAQHERFLVLDKKQILWYEGTLQANPDYTSKVLGPVEDMKLILVTRNTPQQ
jgi:4-amino-4-deoxy-L-arabinose transferase-like glycosyltransferase